MDVDAAATPTDLIALVRETAGVVRAGEADLMVLATEWADAHPDPETDAANKRMLAEEPVDVGSTITGSTVHGDHDPEGPDPRVPAMAWDAGAPFAAALGVSTRSGEAMIREALVLRHRLPKVWARVLAGEVAAWRARRIAQAVAGKPDDVARHLDETVAGVAEKVGPVILDRLIDEAMMLLYPEQREQAQLDALDRMHATLHEDSLTETGHGRMTIDGDYKDLHDFSATLSALADRQAEIDRAEGREPEPLDVRRARAVGVLADPEAAAALLAAGPGHRPTPNPKQNTTLVVHLAHDAVHGTLGGGLGEGVVGRCETLSRPVLAQQVRDWCGRTDTHLTVQPVIDLAGHQAVDRYEIPDRLHLKVCLLTPVCVFPWCTRPARSCDCDHVVAHADGGGTCDCNLAPLCRRHHRLKTKAGWTYRTLDTGLWIWADPHGQRFLRHHRGTTDITADRTPTPTGTGTGCRSPGADPP